MTSDFHSLIANHLKEQKEKSKASEKLSTKCALIKEINFALFLRDVFLPSVDKDSQKCEGININFHRDFKAANFWKIKCKILTSLKEVFSQSVNSNSILTYRPKIEIYIQHSSFYSFSSSWKALLVDKSSGTDSLNGVFCSEIFQCAGGSKAIFTINTLSMLPAELSIFLEFTPSLDHLNLCCEYGIHSFKCIRFPVRKLLLTWFDLASVNGAFSGFSNEYLVLFNRFFYQYLSLEIPRLIFFRLTVNSQHQPRYNSSDLVEVKRKIYELKLFRLTVDLLFSSSFENGISSSYDLNHKTFYFQTLLSPFPVLLTISIDSGSAEGHTVILKIESQSMLENTLLISHILHRLKLFNCSGKHNLDSPEAILASEKYFLDTYENAILKNGEPANTTIKEPIMLPGMKAEMVSLEYTINVNEV